MYKETIKPKEKSAFISVLYIIGLVIGIVALASLATVIQRSLNIFGLEYLVYVFLIVLGVYIYKKRLVEYTYTIIEYEILIEKTVGRRTKPVENIQMKNILAYGKQSEIPKNMTI